MNITKYRDQNHSLQTTHGSTSETCQVQWDARGMLERSKAIKCPSATRMETESHAIMSCFLPSGHVNSLLLNMTIYNRVFPFFPLKMVDFSTARLNYQRVVGSCWKSFFEVHLVPHTSMMSSMFGFQESENPSIWGGLPACGRQEGVPVVVWFAYRDTTSIVWQCLADSYCIMTILLWHIIQN